MIEIKEKTVIYTIPRADVLGQVSPYLFLEKLEDEIVIIWPKVRVNKVFASRKEGSHQLYCLLAADSTPEQIRLIKTQIEIVANSLLADLKEKIYFAGLAS